MLELGRKQQIILLILVGLILFGGGYKLAEGNLEQKPQIVKTESKNNEKNEEVGETSTSNEAAGRIMVHVAGAVMYPGVYELPAGARVNDALLKAMPTEAASLEAINLAQVLQDEDQIVVPDRAQVNRPSSEVSSNVMPFGIRSASGDTSTGAGTKDGKININQADEGQLQALPGIGPTYAKRIIEYREAQGVFSTIEDIKNVSGIGDKRFEALRDLISVK